MNFGDYVKGLNKFLENHPDYAEKDAVISADDDGSSYLPVYFMPSAGHYNKRDLDFVGPTTGDHVEERNINAVCVN